MCPDISHFLENLVIGVAWHLVQDVTQHLQVNGPWPYALSELYDTPEVTAAVQALRAVETAPEEISQLAA